MLGRIRDKLDGAANPIMLKEMWQSVHSKVTMAFFWLLLGVALLFYCLFATQEGSPSGADMFVAFSFLMGGMGILVIPILTYSSLYREITNNTIELLQITAMSAAQLVRGRLLASGVRILLLFALVAPFAVTSFLFGGVDLTTVLATVYFLLVVAIAASAVAVLFSSLAAYRRIRSLARLGFGALVLIPLLMFISGAPAMWTFRSYGPVAFRGAGPGLGALAATMGWFAVLAALFVMLVSAAAANALTFPHGRSSSRTKFFLSLLVVGLFGAFLTIRFAGGALGVGVVFEVEACLLIGVCSLIWITADPQLPHRQRVRLARWGLLRRTLFLPFTDGAAPTALYVALMFAGVALGVMLLDRGGGPRMYRNTIGFRPLVLTFTYVLYLSAAAGMLTHAFFAKRGTAFARRIFLLVLVLVNVIGFIAALQFDWLPGKSPELPMAFLPLFYVLSDFVDLPETTFLAHMALPLAMGVIYHLAVLPVERRRLEENAPAAPPESE